MKNITWLKLIGFILVSELAGILGSFFTIESIPNWYATLQKPSFNPPNWVFGPVWTTLYFLIGLAAYLVWEKKGHLGRNTAMKLFWAQLAANALWTPLFFGAKELGLAFAEIVVMWILILLTMAWFWRVRKLAAVLLLPYLLWVTFASVLNYHLWQLNT
jgi:translocator protein